MAFQRQQKNDRMTLTKNIKDYIEQLTEDRTWTPLAYDERWKLAWRRYQDKFGARSADPKVGSVKSRFPGRYDERAEREWLVKRFRRALELEADEVEIAKARAKRAYFGRGDQNDDEAEKPEDVVGKVKKEAESDDEMAAPGNEKSETGDSITVARSKTGRQSGELAKRKAPPSLEAAPAAKIARLGRGGEVVGRAEDATDEVGKPAQGEKVIYVALSRAMDYKHNLKGAEGSRDGLAVGESWQEGALGGEKGR